MMAAPATRTISTALAAALLCAAAASFLATDAHRAVKPSASDIVSAACANETAHYYHAPGLSLWFCEWALRSDNRSAAAGHPRDLALVALDLVEAGAADAGAKVVGALRSGGAARQSKDLALSLRYCRLDYEAVARTVPVCRGLVDEYDPVVEGHNQGDLLLYVYLECADRLKNAAHSCWGHLHNVDEIKKDVWKEVNEAASRAILAKAMIAQMIGVVEEDHKDSDD